MFLPIVHAGARLITTGAVFEIDSTARFVLQKLGVLWQVVFGNRFLTPLLGSIKQGIDVLTCVPKGLVILLWETSAR